MVRPDGSVRWVRDIGRVVRDERNVPIAFTGAAADITDRKLAESRSDQLAEAALAASRAKDEFLAMLGHELRNPLAPILTALQLMKLRGDRGDGDASATIIERQVQHLMRLVDDLLDVSRITRGKVELKRERVELARRGGARRSRWRARCSSSAAPARRSTCRAAACGRRRSGAARAGVREPADERRASTPSRAGRIEVAARAEGGRGWCSRPRQRHRHRARAAAARLRPVRARGARRSTAAQGGLGLGLALVRSLVALHGGTVAAHSDGHGHGAASSPCGCRAVDAGARAADAATAASPRPRRRTTGRRVLVVDDNVDAADCSPTRCASCGHDVAVAHDGPPALSLARRLPARASRCSTSACR